MKWLVALTGWLRRILRQWSGGQNERPAEQRPPTLRCARVEDLPEELVPATLYLVGEGRHQWAAAMVCPCGCQDVIQLNLLAQARPAWSVQEYPDDTISIFPSVWRTKGCRSHFIVRRSRIEWCRGVTGSDAPSAASRRRDRSRG